MNFRRSLYLMSFVLLSNYSSTAFAAKSATILGTVKIVKGKATLLHPVTYKVVDVQEGMPVYQDSSILTYDRSFVKVVLLSGAQLSIGANTKFLVDNTEDKNTDLVHLFKGKIRAEIEKKNQIAPKFMVKTMNAAMGVRGTEFLISYNEDTSATSLVTFEGEVAVVENKETSSNKTNIANLKEELTQTQTTVKEGQFAGINKFAVTPNIETKVSSEQLKLLKKDDILIGVNPEKTTDKASKNVNLAKNESVVDLETGVSLKGITDIKIDSNSGAFKSAPGLVVTTEGVKTAPVIKAVSAPVFYFAKTKMALVKIDNYFLKNATQNKIETTQSPVIQLELDLERKVLSHSLSVNFNIYKHKFISLLPLSDNTTAVNYTVGDSDKALKLSLQYKNEITKEFDLGVFASKLSKYGLVSDTGTYYKQVHDWEAGILLNIHYNPFALNKIYSQHILKTGQLMEQKNMIGFEHRVGYETKIKDKLSINFELLYNDLHATHEFVSVNEKSRGIMMGFKFDLN